MQIKTPVTRIRVDLKMQRYRRGLTSCLHGNDENDHENANISICNPRRIDLKTQQNENGKIWERIRVTGA